MGMGAAALRGVSRAKLGILENVTTSRAVEISRHPFYLATLFQPQLTSIATGAAHPIIVAYLQSAVDNRKSP